MLDFIDDPSDVTFRLQLALGIADVRVVNTWPIATREEIELFKSQDEIFTCWVDPNSIEPPTQFQKIIDERKVLFGANLTYNLSRISHPKSFTNNPEGQHYLLKVLVMPKRCQRTNISDEIPEGFDSILYDIDTLRVRSVSQVLFVLAVQFELVAYRHQVPDLVCEMCELTLAQWYCPADSAHLCDSCDNKHHSSSSILSRHSRLLVSQSPFLFGYCSIHPSEKVNMVCTGCYKSLCPSCQAFGAFDSASNAIIKSNCDEKAIHEHTLITTTEAYKNSIDDIISSEELSREMKVKHHILLNLYSNYKTVQGKVDQITTALLSQLDNHFRRQLDYLDSRYRQLKLYSDTLDWLIAFIDHVTLTLGPAEFVYFKCKFNLFVESFLEKISLCVIHPQWLMQPLEFWGGFNIETEKHYIDEGVGEVDSSNLDYLDKYDLTRPSIPGINQPIDESFTMYDDKLLKVASDVDEQILSQQILSQQIPSRQIPSQQIPSRQIPSQQILSRQIPDDVQEVPSFSPSNLIYDKSSDSIGSQSPIQTTQTVYYNMNPSFIINPLMVDTLWTLLSEHRFLPLIGLVGSCNVTRRIGFLHDLARLANAYNSLHLLINDYIYYMREKETPEFLMLRSVGSLLDLFSWTLIGEPSTTLDWFYSKLNELDMKFESLDRCIDSLVFDLSSGHIPESLAWSLYQLSSANLGTDLIASLSASLITRSEIGGDDSRHIAYSLSKLGMLIWHSDQNGHLPEVTKKLHKGVERFLKLPRKVVSLQLKNTGDAISVAYPVFEPLLGLRREIYGESECGSSQFDVNINVPNLHEILNLVSESSLD